MSEKVIRIHIIKYLPKIFIKHEKLYINVHIIQISFFSFRLIMLPINLGHFFKTCINSSLLSWSRLSNRFPQHYMLLALVFPQSWKINSYWWRKYKLYKQLRDLCAGTVLTAPCFLVLESTMHASKGIKGQSDPAMMLLIQTTTVLPSNDTYGPQQWTTCYNKIKMLGWCTYLNGN